MNPAGHYFMLKDLELSSIGLPPVYEILVGWNPVENTDEGWFNLKQGVKRDFSHFQLRDFNFNEKIVALESDDKGYSSKSECATPASEGPSNPKCEKVGDSSLIQCRKLNSSIQCSYCYRKVKDIVDHELKCRSKNSKGTERVKCPQCNKQILKNGFSTHFNNTHKLAKKSFSTNSSLVVNDVESREIPPEDGLGREVAGLGDSVQEGSVASVEFDFAMVPSDEVEKFSCRLEFTMMLEGRVFKKTIKSLSIYPVKRAMKKFSKRVDKNLDDLEFVSEGRELDGQEFAGSIERGLITVNLRSSDYRAGQEMEESVKFSDLRKSIVYDQNRRSAKFSSRSSDLESWCRDQEVNQVVSRLGSAASVTSSEATTGDESFPSTVIAADAVMYAAAFDANIVDEKVVDFHNF